MYEKLSKKIEDLDGSEYGYDGGYFYFPEWLIEGVKELEDTIEIWKQIADVKDAPCCPSCGRIRYCDETCGDRYYKGGM